MRAKKNVESRKMPFTSWNVVPVLPVLSKNLSHGSCQRSPGTCVQPDAPVNVQERRAPGIDCDYEPTYAKDNQRGAIRTAPTVRTDMRSTEGTGAVDMICKYKWNSVYANPPDSRRSNYM